MTPEDRLPREILQGAEKIGVRTLGVPEEFGGIELDPKSEVRTFAIISEEIARGDFGLADKLVQNWKVSVLLRNLAPKHKSPRPHRAARCARARWRGDRIDGRCPLLAQSGHWVVPYRARLEPLPSPVHEPRGRHETARVHHLLGGAAARGRLRRARSRASACGASAC